MAENLLRRQALVPVDSDGHVVNGERRAYVEFRTHDAYGRAGFVLAVRHRDV
jgi:hypothetical protein